MNEVFAGKLKSLRSRIDYQGIFLGTVCLVMTLSLLVSDENTRAPISERLMEDRLDSLNQVLPARLYDNNPLNSPLQINDGLLGNIEVYPARLSGTLTAIAFQMKAIGYGGEIKLMMAVNSQGEILGVRVLSHKETPGLADKIESARSDWIRVFDGKSLENTGKTAWAVKKDGGDIDQFTGATITPRAMVKAIYQGLEFYQRHKHVIANSQ